MTTITGTAIADFLIGTNGGDTLLGLGGNDTLDGRRGADVLTGGGGIDTATYSASGAGVNVSIAFNGGGLGGDAAGDTFNSIENVIGSAFDDVIIGDGIANDLRGGAGNDVLNADEGADVVMGEAGNDTLNGGAGDDRLNGGVGADRINGGVDRDRVTYRDSIISSQDGVTVNLTTGVGTGGVAQGDTFVSIEDVEGTQFDDVLTGTGGANDISGLDGDDDLFGEGGNDTLSGGNGNDDLFGGSGTDRLIGGAGRDTMTGGFAIDTLLGGAGDDTYLVETLTDVVDEAAFAGSGSDTIQTVLTYSLNATNVLGRVENLTLFGRANVDGTGNTLANRLTGNAGNNTLDGARGADTMVGLGGNDTYLVDNVDDIVDETGASAGGTDFVQSRVSFDLDGANAAGRIENLTLLGTLDISGFGGAQDNRLTGNSGDNLLDGRSGADTMFGMGGDDTYFVDSLGDVVDETGAGSGGRDQVTSSVSFDLDGLTVRGTVEDVTLSGTNNIRAFGNDENNRLTGNAGNNLLDGRAGNDIMVGGDGDDRYVIDSFLDRVDERGSDGVDTIESSFSTTLGNQFPFFGAIENLTLRENTNAFTGIGNALDNRIIGNSNSNHLQGREGNDALTGGQGSDVFVFNAALDAQTNVDIITDFSVLRDSIKLNDFFMSGLTGPLAGGGLGAGEFRIGSGATDSSDRIIYNEDTGNLFYDEDGIGGVGKVLFARLDDGLAMTAADFFVF